MTHVSGEVRAGDLFAALPGARTHGIVFLPEAVRRGAVAVLTDRAGAASVAGLPTLIVDDPRRHLGPIAARVYGDPARGLMILGVTGTNGKTTVTYLLEGGLRAAGLSTGVIGTTGIRVGDLQLPSARTTPEATDLQAVFGVMRDAGVTAVAMEVSSHALALGRVDAVPFTCGLFTNLSRDHLDFHRDMDDYFAAKASLFDPHRSRQAVICVDDMWGERLAHMVTVPRTTVAVNAPADVRVSEVVPVPGGGQIVSVTGALGSARLRTRLPGRFNAANVVVAWAALRQMDIPAEAVAAGLADVTVPGRMELVDAGQPFAVVVDYAHSPDSVARAIESVDVADGCRRIVVLGCGGDRDIAKRPDMGRVAADRADLLIVTDDNPRSESPEHIRSQMLAGTTGLRADVWEIGDRRDAIAAAVRAARPGDAVLILGKGHETGQEIQGRVEPFDDRVVARRALEGVGS